MRRSLRSSTRRAVRAEGPPTDEIPTWTGPDGVDRQTAQAVIDLAMRAGVAMLSTGAAAADVTATVLLLTRAYGLDAVHVDVTYTSVTVSYHRGPHADPITVMRVLKFRTQDYTRLERLRDLIISLANNPQPVDEARIDFESVVSSPHPYRRWVVTTSGGVLAAGAAGLLGAGPFIVILSFCTALLVKRVQNVLATAGITTFFSQTIGAAIPTVVATLVVFAQSKGMTFIGDVSPSLIVAAGIVLLLSGMSVVGTAEDAIEGYYVTAAARAFEVVVLSVGIAVGISLVLSLGQRLGFPIAITSRTRLTDDIVVQLVCAAVIAVAFAVGSYCRGRVVAAAAVAGVMGWGIVALGERLDVGAITSAGLAAAVVGFVSRLLARRVGVSALSVTTAAIVPLLPGRLAYQGISAIVTRPDETGVSSGLSTLAQAFGTGLALAAGVAMGTYFAGLLVARRQGVSLRPPAAATRRAEPRDRTSTSAILSDSGELPAVAQRPRASRDGPRTGEIQETREWSP
ncbi:MAG: threonine/serine exporter family protein [Humibacillus sp.]|nr:threonine/serine exporter family protein [Humibacillus sp.]MDN5776862.1 threonine/serine exporter family protein [Humibacillus sp.]